MMFRALSLTAAAFALAIAVLGSWIRINGAGMTCPDWPLCNGQIVPPLDGGVLLEWGHRMIVFLEGFVLLGALAAAWRERKRVAGVRLVVALVCATFVVQVGLGAATVALSNTPWSVVIHWGTGMAFLAALVTLAILAVLRPAPGVAFRSDSALLPLLAASAVAAFAAMCAGAYVSSSGNGLACVSVPLCDGSVFGITAGQVAQMTHRILALVFVAIAVTALAAGMRAEVPLRVRVAVGAACACIVAQVVLGVLNVVWMLPTSLREAHAANAALTFVAFVVAFVFARIDGTALAARAPQRSIAGLASKGLGSQ
jgi:heme A synthase